MIRTSNLSSFKAHNFVNGIRCGKTPVYGFFGNATPPVKTLQVRNITPTNPIVITSPHHGIGTLDRIRFNSVQGMTELNTLPKEWWPVHVIDDHTFSVDVDGSTFASFISATGVDVLQRKKDCSDSSNNTMGCSASDTNIIWRDILGLKHLTGDCVSLVAPRVNWTQGEEYAQWSSLECYQDNLGCDCPIPSKERKPHYVLAGDNVYLCLRSSDKAEYMPDRVSVWPETYPDGYIWQYLYSVEEKNKFLTPNWMPVDDICTADDSAEWYRHYSSVWDGKIQSVKCINRGGGYAPGEYELNVKGDGARGKIKVTIGELGRVERWEILEYGGFYTRAFVEDTVPITGDDYFEFVVEVGSVSPIEKYAIYSIFPSSVMFAWSMEGDEDGKFITDAAFCVFGVISQPLKDKIHHADEEAYDMRWRWKLGNAPIEFSPGAIVTDGFARATVVSVNGTLDEITTTVPLPSPFEVGSVIEDKKTNVNNTIRSFEEPGVLFGSGQIIAYDTLEEPIYRDPNQKETYHLIIEF